MTKAEAMKIVAVMFGSYPNSRFSDQNFESYAEGILDLDAGACGKAVQRLIRTSKFLPSIAEIREAATAQQHGACSRGEEAYAALMMACRRYGYDYGSDDARRRLRDPLFDESHIQQCLTLWGGWNAFATADHDAAARARFIAMYDQLASRQRQDMVSGQPLPATSLERALAAPKVAAAPAMVNAEPSAVSALLAAVSRPTAPRQANQELVPRKWTAEELDEALAKAGAK